MYYPARKIRIYRRKAVKKSRRIITLIAMIAGLLLAFTLVSRLFDSQPVEIISPVPEMPTASPSATPGAVIQIIDKVEAKELEPVNSVSGEASYYSRAGCLGCSPTLTMANGEVLDDSRHTLALTPELVAQYKLLNDIVEVKNLDTGEVVKAKVTDTGGFAKYNRVADLSVATKDAISCKSLCNVLISF